MTNPMTIPCAKCGHVMVQGDTFVMLWRTGPWICASCCEGLVLELLTADDEAEAAVPPRGWQRDNLNAEILRNVTRLELIGPAGRDWSKWNISVEASVQDRGRTLKLFYSPLPSSGSPEEGAKK